MYFEISYFLATYQQDKLGQDIFLIGPPGPLRRLLAMQYLVCFSTLYLYLNVNKYQKLDTVHTCSMIAPLLVVKLIY